MNDRILVAGSINLDLVVYCNRLPASGETVHGNHFEIFNGGKGANQAVAVAKLGGSVDMIACLGSDLFSARLLSGLRDAGVGVTAIARVPGPSGVALITTAENGENTIVVASGANAALSPEQIDEHFELVRCASMILVQLEIPLPTVTHLARRALEAGTPLMLDPAPATPLPESLLRCVTWLTPNEVEANILLRGEGLHPRVAAERFLAMGARNVALKMGRAGVFIAGKDCSAQTVPAFPVDAIDTTAAGDCFNAAFALALSREQTPAAAARYAAMAAAISVTRAGAQPSLPSSAEVDAALTAQH